MATVWVWFVLGVATLATLGTLALIAQGALEETWLVIRKSVRWVKAHR